MLEFPKKKELPLITDHRFRQDITAQKMADIVRSLNWGWATAGSRVGVWGWVGGWLTESATWTTVSANGVLNLDQVSPIITPQREEIGPLSAQYGGYVIEVQIYGVAVDLEVQVWPRDYNTDMILLPTHTAIMRCSANGEWSSTSIALKDPAPDNGYMLSFRGRATEDLGGIYQIEINEVRYPSLAYTADILVAYGSEYVGPRPDGVLVFGWDADCDDVTGGQFYRDFGNTAMRRDAIAPGVHAVEFLGDAKMPTEYDVDFSTADGIVGAIALRRNVGSGSTNMRPFSKLNPWVYSMAAQVSNTRAYLQLRFLSVSRHVYIDIPPHGTWYDLVWHWDCKSGSINIWLNGEPGTSATAPAPGDPLYDIPSPIILGCSPQNTAYWDGQIAMPAFFAGDITESDALAYIDYRRHIHGIF